MEKLPFQCEKTLSDERVKMNLPPRRLFHALKLSNTAGTSIVLSQVPPILGLYSSKIHKPYHPTEWATLFENRPISACRGQMVVVLEGPSGCSNILYQKPKCVPPATWLLMIILSGWVIHIPAGVMSSFNKLLLDFTRIIQFPSMVLPKMKTNQHPLKTGDRYDNVNVFMISD